MRPLGGQTKPLFGAQLARTHPAANEYLRAFFAFNEANGGRVSDSVSGVQGTFTNSPTWRPGTRFGGPAVQFGAGSSAYIDLGNPRAMDFTLGPGFTCIFACRCDVKPNYVNRYIIKKGGEWYIDFLGPTGGGCRFVLNGGGGAGGIVNESRAVIDGEDSSWAITYDRTTKFSAIYRDGALVASTTMSVFGDIPTSSASVNIGSDAGTLAWDGSIHWLGLWNAVLPVEAIRAVQVAPFELFRTGRRFFPSAAAAPATTISVATSIGLGASATVTFTAPSTSFSVNTSIGLGAAATVTFASPNTSFSVNTSIGLGASATVTFASPNTTFSVNTSIGLSASATVTFTAPSTSFSVTTTIGLGAAATVTFASPNTTFSVATSIGLGASATVTFASPNTTFSVATSIGLSASATMTFTSLATSISVATSIGLSASATVTFLVNTTIAVNTSIGLSAAATVTFAPPPTTIAVSTSIGLSAAATVTFTAPAGSTSIAVSTSIGLGAAATVTFTEPFVPTTTPAGPERDCYEDIVARLVATKEFARDGVDYGSVLDVLQLSSGQFPCAAIRPLGISDANRWDGTVALKTCSYELTIAIREEQPRNRYRQLEYLAAVAQNALNGVRLAGISWLPLTTLGKGTIPQSDHPEQRIVLNGTFAFVVPDYSGRVATRPS